ncbi:AGR234Wp [Eremothecium gossypii ATCC 10895]|uniref:AGR234Wp n=1 Tax=Eremothecium gossypii (strain ATCC 10895 / CBS 109.51 / FGSC 9923 / NRRL Y-1056) TaxID=284811 RepID=Q74ZH3_EREGS|nr:AGR234Wp [Eremothecium gossypii ATCC 10895]AAS54724.1 AGR234Wp [Eremothecium gossypii ATCC 10895]AEY99055.1 FAGR234Wp [Eremothecium gossypii FDAG1]
MDPYNLKQDNRKRFQDKERLKRRHATPSDRKYRQLHKSTPSEEGETEQDSDELKAQPLLPNTYRYNEDIALTYDNVEVAPEITSKLREVLKQRPDITTSVARTVQSRLTAKELQTKDLKALNALLGSPRAESSASALPTAGSPEPEHPQQRTKRLAEQKPESHVPKDLQEDQDFLDSIM